MSSEHTSDVWTLSVMGDPAYVRSRAGNVTAAGTLHQCGGVDDAPAPSAGRDRKALSELRDERGQHCVSAAVNSDSLALGRV